MMTRSAKRTYGFALLIAVVTFMVYLPALQNGFVNWDDDDYIYKNAFIHPLNAAFFKWAFLDFYDANWHPLTWISHAIDYSLWGLNPAGHHLSSILLHVMTTGLVFLLATRLIVVAAKRAAEGGKPFPDERDVLTASAVAALLFGIHPLHVESAAWISERKDVLCAFFFLLSIMMHMSYRSYKTYKTYCLTLGFFTLALLSKPMAVTLPIVLLILDWYPFESIKSFRTFRTAVVEKLPFFALSLASAVIAVLAQKSSGAIISMESTPLPVRFGVASEAVISYVGKMVFPLNLIPFYPYPKDAFPTSPKYLLFILLTVLVSAVCLAVVKKRKAWPAIWGYYIVTLLPVLGVVQVGYQAMADRYTYLPSLGPFLLAGLAVAWLRRRSSPAMLRGVVAAAAALLVAVLLSLITIRQIPLWKDSFTLWNYEIQKSPEGRPMAYFHRGNAYGDSDDYDRAVADYTTAIDLKPDYFEAFNNRATAYRKKGLLDRAIDDYSKAISLNSNFRIYCNRGYVYLDKELWSKAEEDFNRAIELNPRFDGGYDGLGMVYYLNGRYNSAFRAFNRAIELNPKNPESFVNRGYVYLKRGDNDLARTDFGVACELGSQNGCKAAERLPFQSYF